jgi:hypothetical protein
MRVRKENQIVTSLKFSDRKEEVSKNDAKTSAKVHTAWQAHMTDDYRGRY